MTYQTSQDIKCPKCNSEISKSSKFCGNCGTKIEEKIDKSKCAWCGKKIHFWEDKRWNPIGEGLICEKCKTNPPINTKNLFSSDNITYPIIRRGWNGIIRIYENSIEIDRTDQEISYPFRSLHGIKHIYFDDITSIQFKKADFAVGYIQFTLIGANDSQGYLDNHSSDNAITFSNAAINELWEDLYHFLQNKLHTYKRGKEDPKPITNIISEIDKAANLYKEGLISEEEYQQLKNKILSKTT